MNKEKKAILLLLFLGILMVFLIMIGIRFVLIENYWRNIDTKYAESVYDKNKNTIFRISKIITYSGAEAKDNSDNLQDFNIFQFSDIAIYIDNHYEIEELTEENTIKEMYLDNFKIELPKRIGSAQNMYYKNPFNIGKFRELDFDKIQDKLNYDIIYKNEENDEEFYNTPVFFTDCSNPISLSYINDNIYTNYSVPKNSSISYDGRVLKDIDINLDNIKPKISFTIHVKNNLNEDFVCNVNCNVNFENSEGSIYSGYFVEINENLGQTYKFFKL